MYPDLSYIMHAIFGTDPDNIFSIVKTFGLFLVFSILIAAYMLAKELKRKEEEGLLKPVKEKVVEGEPASVMDLVLNGLLGFVLGFKFFYVIAHLNDFKADPASEVFSMKGNWLGGIVVALLFAGIKYWEKRKTQLPKPIVKMVDIHPYERIGDITVIAAVSGIIGAKLFAIAEDFDELSKGAKSFGDLINQFFSGSGLAIYGGLIVGFIVVAYYVRKKGMSVIHVMDAVAPALLVSAGTGRLGCHFSGDGDWGDPNLAPNPGWLPDWLWAYDYPNNVIDAGTKMADCTWRYCHVLTEPVWPTPVYEFLLLAGLGLFLWMIRKRIKVAGMLFFIYLILNGFERYLMEIIRTNEEYNVLGINMSQAQIIASILILIGIVGTIFLWWRNKQSTEAST